MQFTSLVVEKFNSLLASKGHIPLLAVKFQSTPIVNNSRCLADCVQATVIQLPKPSRELPRLHHCCSKAQCENYSTNIVKIHSPIYRGAVNIDRKNDPINWSFHTAGHLSQARTNDGFIFNSFPGETRHSFSSIVLLVLHTAVGILASAIKSSFVFVRCTVRPTDRRTERNLASAI